jgi:hypothetical protein
MYSKSSVIHVDLAFSKSAYRTFLRSISLSTSFMHVWPTRCCKITGWNCEYLVMSTSFNKQAILYETALNIKKIRSETRKYRNDYCGKIDIFSGLFF